jgi:KR domain
MDDDLGRSAHCATFLSVRLQARHVGKVVLRVRPTAPAAVSAGGGTVITGGLGSLGLLVGQWALKLGTRGVTLLGRIGRAAADRESAGREMIATSHGAELVLARCDAAVSEDVAHLLAPVAAARSRPLKVDAMLSANVLYLYIHCFMMRGPTHRACLMHRMHEASPMSEAAVNGDR